MTETLVRAGGTATPDTYMVTADQKTIVGNGTTADPLRAAPGTTASGLSVVFRPGGVATQNVFPTFDAAVAALSQTQGERVLQFDDSVEPISIPSHPGGGAWPMLGIAWEGYPGRVVHVTIPEGTSFSNLRTIRGLRVTFSGVTPPIADLGAPGAASEALLLDEGATITVSGGGPLLLVSHTAVLRLGSGAGVLTGTFAVITVAAINSLRVTAEGPFATLRDNTVKGDEDEFLLLEIANSAAGDDNGALSTTQAAFNGVIEPLNATASRSYPTSIISGGGSIVLQGASVTVPFDPTTGAVLIFLPPALGLEGRDVTAKNVTASAANDGIIVANGSDTIDGAVNAHVSGAHASTTVRSNGKNQWYIVAKV